MAYCVECCSKCFNRVHNSPKANEKKTIGFQLLSVWLSLTTQRSIQLSLIHCCCSAAAISVVVVVVASFILLKAFGFPSNDTEKMVFLLLFISCFAFSLQSLAIIMIVRQMEWNGKKYTRYTHTCTIKYPYTCGSTKLKNFKTKTRQNSKKRNGDP